MDEQRRFWEIGDEDERGRCVFQLGKKLYADQRETLELDCEDYRFLYEGVARDGSGIGGVATTTAIARLLDRGEGAPSYNVVQASVDTLTAHFAKSPVRPFFLTEKGNHDLREKAVGMSQVVEATFEDTGIYGEKGKRWINDCLINGDGLVYPYADLEGKRVVIDRVMPWEVYVDYTEARKGYPQTLFYVRLESRARMEMLFRDDPKAVARIKEAPAVSEEWYTPEYHQSPEITDFIWVIDAWHLPSCHIDPDDEETEHDGFHSCSVETGELAAGEYKRDYFPIVKLSFKTKEIGWRGRGIPEMLLDIQATINRMLRQIHGIMHLHARPLVYVDRRAKINTDKITNDWGSIIQGNGPGGLQYITPQAVPAEYIRQLETLRMWGFEQVGISELVSTGKRPGGEWSGTALRTLRDEHSLRHSDIFKAVERAHVELAIVVVDVIRQIAESCDDYKVMFGDAEDLKHIDWAKVNLPRDKYQVRAWPTNLFSQTPGAKRQEVTEAVRDGLLTIDQAQRSLDMPDMRALVGDQNVFEENIERMLREIEKGATNVMPHGYLNLELARKKGVERINRLERDGKGDAEITDAIRRWVEQVDEKILEAMQPPPAPQPGPAPAPQPEPGMPLPPGAPQPAVPQPLPEAA